MGEFSSNAKGNTAVALSSTALGLAALNPGGILGGLLGGGVNPMMQKEILDLKTENAMLKSNQFTLEQLQPTQIEVAKQGEQIACLNKQLELRDQIIDGKIAQTALIANNGISLLQQTVASLQTTVNNLIQPFVPSTHIATITGATTATAGA